LTRQSALQKLVGFNPKERVEFYENLLSMLAAEAEICFPGDKTRPGEEYDMAIYNLTQIIKVKGRIHAFYKLNCRDFLSPMRYAERPEIDGTYDVEFLKGILTELNTNCKIERRISDIIYEALRRFDG